MFLSWHWFPALKQMNTDGLGELLYALLIFALGLVGGLVAPLTRVGARYHDNTNTINIGTRAW